jgi:hypothetical protein
MLAFLEPACSVASRRLVRAGQALEGAEIDALRGLWRGSLAKKHADLEAMLAMANGCSDGALWPTPLRRHRPWTTYLDPRSPATFQHSCVCREAEDDRRSGSQTHRAGRDGSQQRGFQA